MSRCERGFTAVLSRLSRVSDCGAGVMFSLSRRVRRLRRFSLCPCRFEVSRSAGDAAGASESPLRTSSNIADERGRGEAEPSTIWAIARAITTETRYFSLNFFKNLKIFRNFADKSAKTPRNAFPCVQARVFSARKDSEKSVYGKLYDQLSTSPQIFRNAYGAYLGTISM